MFIALPMSAFIRAAPRKKIWLSEIGLKSLPPEDFTENYWRPNWKYEPVVMGYVIGSLR